ncbi:hypothetical protein CC80DRAFT_509003 [Byssothecium circinans]|uniref:Uncharacterized protein n=1 Tax=Byssothecium circinans TaxID=147558 RepID=A0A6A5TGB6_9PLEO|nr:hypothetical protein CC80DRAFT_509003 [Byssothecium circinans]
MTYSGRRVDHQPICRKSSIDASAGESCTCEWSEEDWRIVQEHFKQTNALFPEFDESLDDSVTRCHESALCGLILALVPALISLGIQQCPFSSVNLMDAPGYVDFFELLGSRYNIVAQPRISAWPQIRSITSHELLPIFVYRLPSLCDIRFDMRNGYNTPHDNLELVTFPPASDDHHDYSGIRTLMVDMHYIALQDEFDEGPYGESHEQEEPFLDDPSMCYLYCLLQRLRSLINLTICLYGGVNHEFEYESFARLMRLLRNDSVEKLFIGIAENICKEPSKYPNLREIVLWRDPEANEPFENGVKPLTDMEDHEIEGIRNGIRGSGVHVTEKLKGYKCLKRVYG